MERRTAFFNAAYRFDINRDAENFYCGLLNLFFDWQLEDLNTNKDPNYEGADLGDITKSIAVQVTSEQDAEKVHKSINGFKNNSLQQGYKELYILMFRGKPDFPRVDFAKTVDKAFYFDKSKHIIDHENLCRAIPHMTIEKLKTIVDYLDSHGTNYYDIDKDVDDLGIINDIFEHIKRNSPKKSLDNDTFTNLTQINLLPKIKLNFPLEQQDRVNNLLRTVWEKKEVVKEFIQNQEDEISVKELTYTVQENFCNLKGSNNFDDEIQDITIIEQLAKRYIPQTKQQNPAYIANAHALVCHFFEFCFIGKAINNTSSTQLTLSFD